MAYDPSHLRNEPGAAARGPHLPAFERKKQEQPKLDIRYSNNAVSKPYVLCSGSQNLRFQLFEPGAPPFSGFNVGCQRYRLCLDDDTADAHDHEPQEDEASDLVDRFQGLGLDSSQGQRITERLKTDFNAAVEDFAMSQDTSSSEDCCVRPALWLRFGRLTFHTRNRRANLLELPRPFRGSEIEREHARGRQTFGPTRLLKELDPALPKSYFDKLQKLALHSGEDKVGITKKKVFILKIGKTYDEDRNLQCHCMSNGTALKIHKLKRSPKRYFVADLTWAKEWDMRLMLTTEEVHVTALSGEEAEATETIVGGAVVDPETAGGLRWPGSLSGTVIKSSNYVLKQVRRLERTSVRTQKGIVWRFTHAESFDHITRRAVQTSFQVALRKQSWKTSLKDLLTDKDKTDEVADEILETFPEILQWLYEHCL